VKHIGNGGFGVGLIKALEMLTQYRERGVFKWVPQLKDWLRDPAYKFWLGTVQTC